MPTRKTGTPPFTKAVDDTPEQVAESIVAALDFLLTEAETAGLRDLGALIRQASARARELAERSGDAPDLPLPGAAPQDSSR